MEVRAICGCWSGWASAATSSLRGLCVSTWWERVHLFSCAPPRLFNWLTMASLGLNQLLGACVSLTSSRFVSGTSTPLQFCYERPQRLESLPLLFSENMSNFG
ncbi:hypothetical protein JD844_014028 [Phrynosoma platyrhinos]|uniref:Secreted protein n=1 Tax=Phrynosoma platyrhinos TaxID=52577 RepID=A0ABQ7SR22_PHRPL|nr:hypothetical protein JD844_014028 [Phrynosoma platyrhinos]